MKVDIQASAVIFSDYKILLVRRSLRDEFYPGRWDIPGGSLEVTELTLEDVVRRVVQEEVGLQIMPEVMIDNHRKDNILNVVFAARLMDDFMNHPVLSPSLIAFRWATREDAEALSLTPHTRKRMKEVYDYMHFKPAKKSKAVKKSIKHQA